MKSIFFLLAFTISLTSLGQTKSENNLIFISEFSYKFSPQKPSTPREISHKLPIINLIGSNVSKEIQYTFWLFNDSDDTLMITNIESVYSAYFQITNKLLPSQKTPFVFRCTLQNNEYDFTTNHYSAIVSLSNNTQLFFNIVIPTISNNMVVVYKDDGVTSNYAISKQKDHLYNLVIFMNEKGGVIDDAIITKIDDESFHIVVNGACKAKDLEQMKKYQKEFPGVSLEMLEDSTTLVALQGPKASSALEKLLPKSVDLKQMKFMTCMEEVNVGGVLCRLSRCGYTGEDGFEISAIKDGGKMFDTLLSIKNVLPAGFVCYYYYYY